MTPAPAVVIEPCGDPPPVVSVTLFAPALTALLITMELPAPSALIFTSPDAVDTPVPATPIAKAPVFDTNTPPPAPVAVAARLLTVVVSELPAIPRVAPDKVSVLAVMPPAPLSRIAPFAAVILTARVPPPVSETVPIPTPPVATVALRFDPEVTEASRTPFTPLIARVVAPTDAVRTSRFCTLPTVRFPAVVPSVKPVAPDSNSKSCGVAPMMVALNPSWPGARSPI